MVNFTGDVKISYPDYLDDESGIAKDASADRIYFPSSEDDIVSIVKDASNSKVSITISGGGTGLSGGRVPEGGWIIATDKMLSITDNEEDWTDEETGITYGIKLEEKDDEAYLTVPVGMTLKSIQNFAREKNWFYPPDPTERSSFIGGNVSTNASGARSFKYGPTRRWIKSLNIILPNGQLVSIDREDNGKITTDEIVIKTEDHDLIVPRPVLQHPNVTKHVVGPVITNKSDPIDLFIGTNGIFGIVTEVTVKLIKPAFSIISIFTYCTSVDQAFKIINISQQHRENEVKPIPMSVEFIDRAAIEIMRQKDSNIPDNCEAIIMMEQDVDSEEELDKAIAFWTSKFEEMGIKETSVAQSHKEIEHHKFLRHCVPEYIISLSKTYNQSLVVTDTSVPQDRFSEFFHFLLGIGNKFEELQGHNDDIPAYSLFGHAGDCHPHLSLIPRDDKESSYAEKLLVEVLKKTVELGGSIASEHGLGKKRYLDNPALHLQYGDSGIEEVEKIKRIIDPHNLFCPGNLIPAR